MNYSNLPSIISKNFSFSRVQCVITVTAKSNKKIKNTIIAAVGSNFSAIILHHTFV